MAISLTRPGKRLQFANWKIAIYSEFPIKNGDCPIVNVYQRVKHIILHEIQVEATTFQLVHHRTQLLTCINCPSLQSE